MERGVIFNPTQLLQLKTAPTISTTHACHAAGYTHGTEKVFHSDSTIAPASTIGVRGRVATVLKFSVRSNQMAKTIIAAIDQMNSRQKALHQLNT